MQAAELKKVLVVDDDEDVVAYLSTWLSDQGFAVDTAKDGNEALAKIQAGKPDLITLDIVMPEKTGVRLYREIRKNPEYAHIPVIIITGLQAEFESFISHRRTAPPPDGYLAKPFSQAELLAMVQKVLNIPQTQAVVS